MNDNEKPVDERNRRKPAQKTTRKAHKPGEDIKHVVETGLPPGISVEQAKDPGAHAPGGPVENRS
ncbi:MAG: hypothetical protein JWN94_3099 [Betaproteobacteria bacterium]|nr:hypothetical protein [Betaproteobacteria bacterium]